METVFDQKSEKHYRQVYHFYSYFDDRQLYPLASYYQHWEIWFDSVSGITPPFHYSLYCCLHYHCDFHSIVPAFSGDWGHLEPLSIPNELSNLPRHYQHQCVSHYNPPFATELLKHLWTMKSLLYDGPRNNCSKYRGSTGRCHVSYRARSIW